MPGPQTVDYQVTPADRRPLPARPGGRPRLGYTGEEADRPFAHFFRPDALPIQAQASAALAGGPMPRELAYDVTEAADRLERPGHHGAETGWARLANGVTYVSCLTDMPGVSASMWDWWFGWHSTDPARYKLWHPQAHLWTAIGEDRSADRDLTDRQRYLGNVSYVDEYIGRRRHRLAIRFLDPARLGLPEIKGGTTICARTSLFGLPIAMGWIVHQVRPTWDGCEMRSRFFINHIALLDLPAPARSRDPLSTLLSTPVARAVTARLPGALTGLGVPSSLGPDLLHHCATEMNHLASFLPQLHEEFADLP